jgi:hypothetical protein
MPWLTQRTLADLEAEIRQCENIAWQAVAVASRAEERQRELEDIRDKHLRISEWRAADTLLYEAKQLYKEADRAALSARWTLSHQASTCSAGQWRLAVENAERLEELRKRRLEDLGVALELERAFRQ